MIVQDCDVCGKEIRVDNADDLYYNYEMGYGPCCDACAFFVRHIEALRDRVTDLESRVKDEQAYSIRNDSRVHRIIAEEYGVARSTISAIKRGETWK